MKLLFLNLPLFICLINGILNESDKKDNILILTDSNFNQTIELFQIMVVEFYAPWDEKSKKLEQEFSLLEKLLTNHYPNRIKLGKLDATDNPITSDILATNISGFPTLFYYENNQRIEYLGQEKADKIFKWLQVITGLGVIRVNNTEQLKKLNTENEVFFLGFYIDLDSPQAKLFVEISKSYYDLKFGITSDKDLFTEYKISNNGNLIAFKHFDERKMDYTGSLDNKEEIRIFINGNKFPLLSDFEVHKSLRLVSSDNLGNMYLFISKKASNYKQILYEFRKSAEKFRGKIVYSIANVDTKENEHLFEYFGFKISDVPFVRITAIRKNMIKFKPENKQLTENAISEFAQNFLDGKIAHYLLTEDIPTDWNARNVKKLVGKNFNQTARNKRKNAPWCLFSQNLRKVFEKVGEEFKRSKEHIVTEIDATANEIEDIRIEKFPTIKLFPKNSEQILDFNGAGDEDDLIKFLENHGKMNHGTIEHDEL